MKFSYHTCRGKREGVYFLYNDEGPVYIGRSVNLNQRVTIHLLGNEKSTRQVASRIKSVKGFFVEDICVKKYMKVTQLKYLSHPTIGPRQSVLEGITVLLISPKYKVADMEITDLVIMALTITTFNKSH
ncbi:GIY-YIG nuclease family protein [Paenibacillus sp. DP01]|uniref:GIY-YIG nuclease family protein n=1 Tax=Paenibacillus sp. DP01 TaxID=3373096 RepID=UPI00384ABBF0